MRQQKIVIIFGNCEICKGMVAVNNICENQMYRVVCFCSISYSKTFLETNISKCGVKDVVFSAIVLCKFIFEVLNNSDNQIYRGSHYKTYSILFPVTNIYIFQKKKCWCVYFFPDYIVAVFRSMNSSLNIFIFTSTSELSFDK